MKEKLQEAVSLYKKGDKAQASKLLAEIVRQEPNNSVAWYGLALCLDDPEKKTYCLRKVLSLDSSHKKAQQLLDKLQVAKQQPKSQGLVGQTHSPTAQKKASPDWILISVAGLLAAIIFCVFIGIPLSSRMNLLKPTAKPILPTRISPTRTTQSSPTSSVYIVGTWSDNWTAPCTITIKKINGTFQMTRLYSDGSGETKTLVVQTVGGTQRLIEYPDSPTGDYMVIENGNLVFYDNQGFIYEDYPK